MSFPERRARLLSQDHFLIFSNIFQGCTPTLTWLNTSANVHDVIGPQSFLDTNVIPCLLNETFTMISFRNKSGNVDQPHGITCTYLFMDFSSFVPLKPSQAPAHFPPAWGEIHTKRPLKAKKNLLNTLW